MDRQLFRVFILVIVVGALLLAYDIRYVANGMDGKHIPFIYPVILGVVAWAIRKWPELEKKLGD